MGEALPARIEIVAFGSSHQSERGIAIGVGYIPEFDGVGSSGGKRHLVGGTRVVERNPTMEVEGTPLIKNGSPVPPPSRSVVTK